MRVLLCGNQNHIDFFALYLTNNQLGYNIYADYKNSVRKDPNFDVIISFLKSDIHSVEDELRDIIKEFNGKVPVLVILEENKFNIIDTFFSIGTKHVFFDFKPESIVEEINRIINLREETKNSPPLKDEYVINFYENSGAFIIDISGLFTPERIKPLKLMFSNYLKERILTLKVIIYVFANTDEKSFNFVNIWTLFRIWKELNFSYNKITFLSSSEKIKSEIEKFFTPFGLLHSENLLDIVKKFFPDTANKDESYLFDFSAKLLQSQLKSGR